MKNVTKRFLLALFLILLGISSYSQKILTEYDSIATFKHKAIKNSYEIANSDLKEISIVNKSPKPVTRIPKKFWGNLAEGIITLSTGIVTNVEEEALWLSHNELVSENIAYNWRVPLYFSGTFYKTRERIKNEDGSSSIETQEGIYVDWSNGIYGLIIDQSDTIGSFTVVTDLRSDSESQQWLNGLESESRDIYDKIRKYEPLKLNYDFVIRGTFGNREFYIITSGTHLRSLFIINNNPEAIFQSDPNFIVLSKKDRITPYLLLKKDFSVMSQIDFYRLIMLKNLIAGVVRTDYYQK